MKILAHILLLFPSALGTSSLLDATPQEPRLQQVSHAEERHVAKTLGQLPLYFISNEGQVDDDGVSFYVKGADKTLFFTPSGITFALHGQKKEEISRWTIKLDFLNHNFASKPIGEDRQNATFSYFKGRSRDWNTDIATYGKVVYRDLWPGVDLVYSGTVNELKYEFLVKPGADPNQIRLAYRGVSSLTISGAGELDVATPQGGFKDDTPVAWQMIEGERKAVSVRYVLEDPTEDDVFPYCFEIGYYDPMYPLVLDPAILVYCGYIGGRVTEKAWGIAVDGEGRAYVIGETSSNETSFPVSVGPDVTYNGGRRDVFVARVNAQGTALDYCGYIGGADDEYGNGIAVDSLGRAYVTGETFSDQHSFPLRVGPDLTYDNDGDAFVARVNAQGTDLEYCGYIGGGGWDKGRDIAVDTQGRAYITGGTRSTEHSFPVSVGPDVTFNGFFDAFVARVSAQGTNLEYCGYIGGILRDQTWSIAVDGQGNAYVAGDTDSDPWSFPLVVGPDLTYNGGLLDIFVARVNAQGTHLDYCGYIGGSDIEASKGIDVDSYGNAYVTGYTSSDETSFPVLVGPDLSYNGGIADPFVAKVNTSGAWLDYCGYIGGDSFFTEQGDGIAVDGEGNAYVVGHTSSDESSFPVSVGPDLSFNGGGDAFIARVNVLGTLLDFCGYIGGTSGDNARDVAVDNLGNVYVVGHACSDESTFPVVVGPDLTIDGCDVFVAKIEVSIPRLAVSPNPLEGGHYATYSMKGGKPNEIAYLAFSLTGMGSTPVPFLSTTLDLTNPAPAAIPTRTDDQGQVSWGMYIPPATGRLVWAQAAQYGEVSNVLMTLIQ